MTRCWPAPIVRTSLDEFGNTVSSTAKILDRGSSLCLDMSEGASAFSVRDSGGQVFIQARGLQVKSKGKDGTVWMARGEEGNATFFIGKPDKTGTFLLRGCFWRAADVTCATPEVEVEKPAASKPVAPKTILPSNLSQRL